MSQPPGENLANGGLADTALKIVSKDAENG